MKVLPPTKNKLNHGYTTKHHGYDFDDVPDTNYYSSFHGVVVNCKNNETRTWIANKPGDPFYEEGKTRKLRTEDYGNYIKIKAEVDGKTVYQLGAHFRPGTVLEKGTEVKKGQVVAQADPKGTGNSSGGHSHTEYRDDNEASFAVEFSEEEEAPEPIMEDKRQQIIDIYKGTTGEYPSEDEISARLQQGKNRVELIEDILTGDGRAKARWEAAWGVTSTNWKEVAKGYQDAFESLKDLFKMSPVENTQEVLGKVAKLKEDYEKLVKESKPQTIYKYQDVDYQKVLQFMNLVLIIENKAG